MGKDSSAMFCVTDDNNRFERIVQGFVNHTYVGDSHLQDNGTYHMGTTAMITARDNLGELNEFKLELAPLEAIRTAPVSNITRFKVSTTGNYRLTLKDSRTFSRDLFNFSLQCGHDYEVVGNSCYQRRKCGQGERQIDQECVIPRVDAAVQATSIARAVLKPSPAWRPIELFRTAKGSDTVQIVLTSASPFGFSWAAQAASHSRVITVEPVSGHVEKGNTGHTYVKFVPSELHHMGEGEHVNTMLHFNVTAEDEGAVGIAGVPVHLEVQAMPSIQNSTFVLVSEQDRCKWPCTSVPREGAKITAQITSHDHDGFTVTGLSELWFVMKYEHTEPHINGTVDMRYKSDCKCFAGDLTVHAVVGSYTAWIEEVRRLDGTAFVIADAAANCSMPLKPLSGMGDPSCQPTKVDVCVHVCQFFSDGSRWQFLMPAGALPRRVYA